MPREQWSALADMDVEDQEGGNTNKSRRGPDGTLPPANGEVSEEQRAKQEAQKQEVDEQRQQRARQEAIVRAQQMLEQAKQAKLASKDDDDDNL